VPLPLDVRSIALACAVAHLAVAVAMTYVRISRKTYAGFGAWALSAWCAFGGILLVAVRGFIPDFFSILIANLLLVATSSLILTGLIAFSGRRPDHRLHAGLLTLYTLLMALFLYGLPSLQARLVVISFTIGGLGLTSAHIARKHVPAVLHNANPLVLGTILFVAVMYVLRGLLSLAVPSPTEDFMSPSPVQGLSLLIYLLGHTTLSAGLLVLNGQRVEQDLQGALEECKVLRGILPICAHCKKIRDDQGAWNQIEAYLHQHTEAEFSHGICPECAKTAFLR
jgi:hypothetical protein